MIAGFLPWAAQTIGPRRFLGLEAYDDARNYIGPGRAALGILRKAYGFDFNPAGWIHDGDYERGGSDDEREIYDRDFLLAMLFIVEKTPLTWGTGWFRRILGRQRAMNYYQAVREGGRAFCKPQPEKGK
jgi:hypothetical protein